LRYPCPSPKTALSPLWAALELNRYEKLLLEHHRWLETADSYAAGLPRGDGLAEERLAERPTIARP